MELAFGGGFRFQFGFELGFEFRLDSGFGEKEGFMLRGFDGAALGIKLFGFRVFLSEALIEFLLFPLAAFLVFAWCEGHGSIFW